MRRGFIRISLVLAFVLIAALVVWPVALQADQAQYFYDDLGRLVTVIDGSGNVAIYNYDAVGNLLSIQRFTSTGGGGGGGNIGIFILLPSSGGIGAQVRIQGFGFSATPSANQVAFNGTAATVTSATANALVVTVPTGATTGPVTVANTNGTAMSPQPFTVLNPTITGIDPSRVAQGTTNYVVIGGSDLAKATAVQFSQAGLTVSIIGGKSAQSLPIILTVASNVPAGAYTFSVTTPGGTAQSGSVTVTVGSPVPTLGVTRLPVSVKMPLTVPASQKLAGPSATNTTAISVLTPQPVPATQAPSGPSATNTSPTSVQMPTSVPATQAPSGSDATVARPESVSMP
jgi:YD repeat-containing protein